MNKQVEAWLMDRPNENTVHIEHGGKGGQFYCLLTGFLDGQEDREPHETQGTGTTVDAAINAAWEVWQDHEAHASDYNEEPA